MTNAFHNLPRLYTELKLSQGASIPLTEDQSHYLRNVLRKTVGDTIRIFNPTHGEWVAKITAESKKLVTVTMEQNIRAPEPDTHDIHLIFSPIKKDRNDMLIEKAVELGVTHLHPVLFSRTIVRDIKEERIKAQIIEAAEQCERLSVPTLHPLIDLKKCLSTWNKDIPVYAGIERSDAIFLQNKLIDTGSSALLIGPEGGITSEEIELLNTKDFIKPVSFGPRILRAETAVFYGLSILSSKI